MFGHMCKGGGATIIILVIVPSFFFFPRCKRPVDQQSARGTSARAHLVSGFRSGREEGQTRVTNAKRVVIRLCKRVGDDFYNTSPSLARAFVFFSFIYLFVFFFAIAVFIPSVVVGGLATCHSSLPPPRPSQLYHYTR